MTDPMPAVRSILGMPPEPERVLPAWQLEPFDYRADLAALIVGGTITPDEAAAIENDPAFLSGPGYTPTTVAARDIAAALERIRGNAVKVPRDDLATQLRIANLIAWEALTGEKNRALVREGLGL